MDTMSFAQSPAGSERFWSVKTLSIRGWRRLFAAAILGAAGPVAAPMTAQGVDGTFLGPEGGTWSDLLKWEEGVVANGAGAHATLSGAGGGTIILDHPVEIGSLGLSGFAEGGSKWILSGGPITFNSGEAGAKSIIDLIGSSAGQRLEIASAISGTSGLSIRGGTLLLSGTNNTFTGGIDLDGRLRVGGAGSLNGNTLRFTGANAFFTTGSSTATYSSNIILAADKATILSHVSSGTVTFSGVISEEGGSRDIAFSQPGVGLSTIRLTGDNTYTGNTLIGRANNDQWALVISAENDNAFGRGNATVSFAGGTAKTFTNDAVWLSGGVTIANKTLVLRGGGYQNNGSLRNRSGDNEWAGEIDLGDADSPRIGVDGGTTLIVSGQITGAASGGLVKSGAGRLVLTGDNDYSTGTTILAGAVVAGHKNAFGGGSADLSLHEETLLEVAAGVNLELDTLALSTSTQLTFDLRTGGESRITLFGDQTGAGNYQVNLLGAEEGLAPGVYTLLSVAGDAAASGFFLGEHALASEGGNLHWDAAAGVLTYTVIPEARSGALLGLGLLVGLGYTFRRQASLRRAVSID